MNKLSAVLECVFRYDITVWYIDKRKRDIAVSQSAGSPHGPLSPNPYLYHQPLLSRHASTQPSGQLLLTLPHTAVRQPERTTVPPSVQGSDATLSNFSRLCSLGTATTTSPPDVCVLPTPNISQICPTTPESTAGLHPITDATNNNISKARIERTNPDESVTERHKLPEMPTCMDTATPGENIATFTSDKCEERMKTGEDEIINVVDVFKDSQLTAS